MVSHNLQAWRNVLGEPLTFTNVTIGEDGSMTVEMSVTMQLSKREQRMGFVTLLTYVTEVIGEAIKHEPMHAVATQLLAWKKCNDVQQMDASIP